MGCSPNKRRNYKGGGCHGIVFEWSNSSIEKSKLTSHIEIENIEVTNAGASAIACKIDNAGNGMDGRDNSFAMEDIFIHDNYLHDIGMEGIYIGQSTENPVWHSTINVKLYNNLIVRTGFEPIQLRNALQVEVHNNICYQASLLDGTSYGVENNGFQIERGTRGNFYNNIIMDGKNEMVHGMNREGYKTAFLPELPEGNLINKLGAGIEFYNNYLDGGAETYTWDDKNDVNDFNSVSAAFYCESDYLGTEKRVTNFEGNYVRNIYRGANDPGKPKADLEYFFIKQDNPATPEDDEDPVIYNIFNNYFSGGNGMETHGTVPTLQLGENQVNLNLEEIRFVDPVYGKDNFCIVPGSFYYDKGVSSSRPDAKGFGLTSCIVSQLNVNSNAVNISLPKIFDFTLNIYNKFATSLIESKAILMFSPCENCTPVKISDAYDVRGGVKEFEVIGKSFTLNPSDLNYGEGVIYAVIFDPQSNHKSNEINLVQNSGISGNEILTEDKVFYSNASASAIGAIVGNSVSGSIQWERSIDQTNWTPLTKGDKIAYVPDEDLNTTTYFRRVNNGSPSNIFTVTVIPGTVTHSEIGSSQWFLNSGDPLELSGSPDKLNGVEQIGNVYQWQMSMDNIIYYDIPGANGLSYDPGIVYVTTYYRRNLTGYESSENIVKIGVSHLTWATDTAFLTSKCLPANYNVQYTAWGKFPGNPVFKLELSDNTGSFDNPIVLGTSDTRPGGTITGDISSSLPEGKYKLRLASSSGVGAVSESKELCFYVLSNNSATVVDGYKLYPNPSKGEARLVMEHLKGQEVMISVVDLFGRKVITKSIIAGNEVLIGSNLGEGTYFVTIDSGKEKRTLKFIKIR
ncbi:MAG: T9SS type A sorting domain-containing protein [Sporocytophaga sp.]|nr:T9SS type A sorting domain-containing protein [Sporocytophaga sp.]